MRPSLTPSGSFEEHLWTLVLAAGDGRRLATVSFSAGDCADAPKQFRRFDGGESMLRWTIRRAGMLVPAHRIVVIVARDHERWWRQEIGDLEPTNVVVQPANKGTVAGILLPLLRILSNDPGARVVVLPCDHFVDDETRLARSLRGAIEVMEAFPDRIVLVGMEPGVEMEDYGWIVPGDPVLCGDASTVRCFVEKPDRSTLDGLLQRGALVNSLMLTARAGSLGRLIARAAPEVATPLLRSFPHSPGKHSSVNNLYRGLRARDFSRHVLESCPDSLLVYPAPASCGWSDLGTPGRLGSYLRQKRMREARRACEEYVDSAANPRVRAV